MRDSDLIMVIRDLGQCAGLSASLSFHKLHGHAFF